MRPIIIAIASGKGGVGKSVIASSISMYLSQLDFNVLSVDLDFGCANLHTLLGESSPSRTLSQFVKGSISNINELVIKTAVKNLSLISGAYDDVDFNYIPTTKVIDMMRQLRFSKSDYIVLDLGAGNSEQTQLIFNSSDKKILVTTPDLLAMENIHRFAKLSFLNQFKMIKENLKVNKNFSKTIKESERKIESPAEFLAEMSILSEDVACEIKNYLEQNELYILVNKAKKVEDKYVADNIVRLYKKYLGLNAISLGSLDYSNELEDIVRSRKIALKEKKELHFINDLKDLTLKMIA